MYNEPLGLPKGSVRAIIALTIIGGTILGGLLAHFRGLLPLAEDFWTIAGIVAAFYFGQKSGAVTIVEKNCDE